MEMTYDGLLVMPSSYAVMSEEEMTYLDGGAWSIGTLWNNIVHISGQYAVVKSICKTVKWNGTSIWSYATAAVVWTQSYAQTALASLCTALGIQASTVNIVLGAILALSAAAAIYKLGTTPLYS